MKLKPTHDWGVFARRVVTQDCINDCGMKCETIVDRGDSDPEPRECFNCGSQRYVPPSYQTIPPSDHEEVLLALGRIEALLEKIAQRLPAD